MQLFWYPPLDEVWRFDYNSSDMPEEYVPEILSAPAQEPAVPTAEPSPPAGPIVSAQAVGGRRHLTQGMQLIHCLRDASAGWLCGCALQECREYGLCLCAAPVPVLAPDVFAQAPTPELGPRPLYIAAPAQ